MNLAEQMAQVATTITNKDKLDIVFNNLVLPKIQSASEKKKREISFNSFGTGETSDDTEMRKQFPAVENLQALIGGEMKPYLIEKGFKLITCQPAYYTYIKW